MRRPDPTFNAALSYPIGPYTRPSGWVAQRWAYRQLRPRAYFAVPYRIAD